MDLSELDTEVDVEELASEIDDFLSEIKEWAYVCSEIERVMNDVRGALDAEDVEGAVEDALTNIRLLDFSGPRRMESLLPAALDAIESKLDDLRTDIAAAEPELPFSVGVNGESPILLRRFATEREATEFVGNLEGADEGRYYLDGPER